MEFPDDVLQHIRAFSQPRWTRKDWRTCKQIESNLIAGYHKFIRYVSSVVFYQQDLSGETKQWTLYGVAYLLFLLKDILWTVDYIDLLPIRRECTKEYLKQYRDIGFAPDLVSEGILRNMRKRRGLAHYTYE